MARSLKLIRTAENDYPTYDYDWATLPPPTWAIIREVNWKIVPGNPDGTPEEQEDSLVFYYSQYSRDRSVPTPSDFQTLLKEICKPDYKFDGGPSEPKEPYDTMLSLDSGDRLSYIILKLAKNSWQFSRRGRPIKIDHNGTAAEAYYDAHRVDRFGSADKGDVPSNIRDHCKVAYFISDGPKAKAHGTYPHSFNLYVDLKFTGGGVGHMPIMIDPDVRHPGGSTEP